MAENIVLDREIAEKSKVVACKIDNKELRKRVYALNIAANVVADYLSENGCSVDTEYSLYKIPSFSENFELADIYVNERRLDVRVTFDEKIFYIPKSHEKYDAEPTAYVIAKLDSNLENIKILGYIPSKDITKQSFANEYFVYETSVLKPIGELNDFLSQVAPQNDIPSPYEIEKINELAVSFIDDEIAESEKVYFIKSVVRYPLCRKTLYDMSNFNNLAFQVSKYEELLNDSTLSVLSGNQREVEEALIANMSTVENAEENLDTLVDIEENLEDAVQEVEMLAESATADELLSETAELADVTEPVELLAETAELADVAEPVELFAESEEEEDIIKPMSLLEQESMNNAELELNDSIESLSDGELELESIVEENAQDDFVSDLEEKTEEITLEEEQADYEEIQVSQDEDIELVDESITLEEDINDLTDIDSQIKALGLGELHIDNANDLSIEEEQDSLDNENDILMQEVADLLDADNELAQDVAEENEDEQEMFSLEEESQPVQVDEVFETVPEEETFVEDTDVVGTTEANSADFSWDEDIDVSNISSEDNSKIQAVLDDDLLAILSGDSEESSTANHQEQPDNPVFEEEIVSETGDVSEDTSFADEQAVYNDFASENVVPVDENVQNIDENSYENQRVEPQGDETIETLFEAEGPLKDGEEKQFELAQDPVAPNRVSAVKNIIILVAIIVMLAGGSIVAWFMNQHAKNVDNAAEATNQDEELFNLNNNVSQSDEQAPALSQDINKSMTNSFSDKPAAITITKLSWQVSEKLAMEDSVKEYLQSAGKNIQINLQNDLANSADINFNNNIKVSFEIAPDNTMKGIQILESSGSDQIDEIVMRSIKNTLKYISVPKLNNFNSDFFLTLIINF